MRTVYYVCTIVKVKLRKDFGYKIKNKYVECVEKHKRERGIS